MGRRGRGGPLDALSELIVLTASRCLLGREIRETLFSEVTNLVHDLDKGMVPLSVFFPYAPIEAHRKRDKARKELAAIFDKVIQGRRESGAMEPAVLQTFIDARYKDGSRLSNDQVLGMLIAVPSPGSTRPPSPQPGRACCPSPTRNASSPTWRRSRRT